MNDEEIREFKADLGVIKQALEKQGRRLHDLTLSITGDDDKGLVGVVQRQQGQGKRIKTIEYIGSGVLIFLVISNPTFKDLFISILK